MKLEQLRELKEGMRKGEWLMDPVAVAFELLELCIRQAEALKPFVHPDLLVELGGNAEGDDSIVYQRNKAVLRLGDFRRAQQALEAE